jgi:hypothetical protein
VIGYVRRLWRGELPLARVFWHDMLVVGTLVNLAAMFLALLLFGMGAPTAVAVAVHFSPVPYNVLLFMAVWQSAAGESPGSWAAQTVALVWLIASILI